MASSASRLSFGLGLHSVQVYDYHTRFPNDRLVTKILAYGVFLLELPQTSITTYDAFAAFGIGNYAALLNMKLSWLCAPILSAVVASIGQTFYAHRISILSSSRSICYVILSVTLHPTRYPDSFQPKSTDVANPAHRGHHHGWCTGLESERLERDAAHSPVYITPS